MQPRKAGFKVGTFPPPWLSSNLPTLESQILVMYEMAEIKLQMDLTLNVDNLHLNALVIKLSRGKILSPK